MDKSDLLELRKQIIVDSKELALDSDAPLASRLFMVLESIRGGDIKLLKKAFEMARGLEDETAKLEAMIELISLIDEVLATRQQSTPTADDWVEVA